MSTIIKRAKIWAEFERMRIKHPRLSEAHDAYDDLRESKRSTPNSPQRFVALFAPTHSGKSMSVRTYIESKVVDAAVSRGLFPADMDRNLIAKRQNIVLHVTLSAKASPKSLATDILRELGDARADKGTASSLLARSYDLMAAEGTELLIVDEIQHLSGMRGRLVGGSSRGLMDDSTSVTDTLKTMMIRGLVPMVFIGVEEARHFLFNDAQLAGRCLLELNYNCLDWADLRQREIFRDYCGRLGLKLKQHKLFKEAANFLIPDILACLHEISKGRIGVVSRLVQHAAALAAKKNADTIQREHLETATDTWAIPNDFIDYNPFQAGVRRVEKKRA